MSVQNEDVVNVDKIKAYIEIISKKPRIVNYFCLLEDKTFILNGKRLTMLPPEYTNLSSREDFVVFVNPHTQKVLYYAFDIEDIVDHTRCNEVEGEMIWDRVERNIYAFLVKNIKELTADQFPHLSVSTKTESKASSVATSSPYDDCDSYYGNNNWLNRSRDTHDWNSSYKEREAFYEKLYAFMKTGKVSNAVDFVEDDVSRMCKEEKFESLDTILRMLDFNKYNIPVIFSVLDAAKEHKAKLKAYEDYIERVKTHLTKFRPEKVESFMEELAAA
jgi:hypothetical protein